MPDSEDLVARLIRIEERQVTNVERLQHLEGSIEKLENKLEELKALFWKIVIAGAGSGGAVAAGVKMFT